MAVTRCLLFDGHTLKSQKKIPLFQSHLAVSTKSYNSLAASKTVYLTDLKLNQKEISSS